MVRALSERRFIPEVLREPFTQFEPNGSLSDVDGIFAQFRQASDTISRQAGGS